MKYTLNLEIEAASMKDLLRVAKLTNIRWELKKGAIDGIATGEGWITRYDLVENNEELPSTTPVFQGAKREGVTAARHRLIEVIQLWGDQQDIGVEELVFRMKTAKV